MDLLGVIIKVFVIGGFFLIVISKFSGKSIGEIFEWVNNLFNKEEEE